jgi:hypothetical protein
MSQVFLLQKFPEGTARPEQVSKDYLPPAVGSRANVAAAVRKLFRNAEGAGDSFISVTGSKFSMEISFGDTDPCSQLLLHVSGDATKAIQRLANHIGMRAIDCSSGDFIEAGRRKREVSEKEREDEARYRRSLEEHATNPVPPPVWPLSGLERGPCDRYIYVSFLPGESPKQLQKAVFRHWGDLFQEHGELLASIGGPLFVLTLPDGDPFGDICVASHPALVTETEAEMIPRVEKGVELIHALAAATGRRSGEIEDGSDFVCNDGQRIPLPKCTYRLLWTDKDYARKAKRKKTG